MAEQVVRLTRPQLYERVWTKAVSRVAPELGISDVGLRKICQRFDIPLPPLGYWAKKQHGKHVRQTPLRPMEALDDEPFVFTCPAADANEAAATPEAVAFHERERLAEHRITVADTLDAPHELVERTLRSMNAAKPNEAGLVRPKAKRCFNVLVSPDTLDRAMRIMDALIKSFEARDLRVAVEPSTREAQVLTVLGERLTFSLEELTDRRERPLTEEEQREADFWGHHREVHRYERFPSGRLSLSIGNGPTGARHRWSDSGRQRLESLLNAFVRGLARNAEALKLERAEAERRRREWEIQEQKRREEAERRRLEEEHRRAEEARFQELEKMVGNWHRGLQIRSFLDAIEQAAKAQGTRVASDSQLGQWLVWARDRADQIDPIHGAFEPPQESEDHVQA